MSAGPERTEPAAPAPPATPSEPPTIAEAPAPPVTASMAFGGKDSCSNCGARMAADQHYCLSCGHRRGEPRLPFMDAVVFMESMSAPAGAGGVLPPPPPPAETRSNRMNANAALIAGVATLVLAIGVGFLIGRSGHENAQPAATPQVIKVEGGGGGTETAETATESVGGAKKAANGKSGAKKSAVPANSAKATAKAKEKSQTGAHGASEAVEEVLHTEGNVKLPEAEQKVGGSCTKGTAGCSGGGEFTGNFFGE